MSLERFVQYLQFERRYSTHTIVAYRNDISHFLESIDHEVFSASRIDVRNWMLALSENKQGPKTIGRKLSSVRAFYKFLMRERLVSSNPVEQVKAPKAPKQLPVTVDENSLCTLLDGEHTFEKSFSGLIEMLIVELLFGTGIRLAELLALRESDFNRYDRSLRVFGKRRKERIIPLNTELSNRIVHYLDEKKKQNFDNNSLMLIVTKKGRNAYPTFIYRTVKSLLENISTHKKKSPHVLRHTFATSLLHAGADINAIKELLGHSSLAATQVYTHNSIERLKSVYKQAHPKA